ncbi:MAG: hypothetical protein ACRDPC_14875 [Solirubrobacteraceae bacterium]
MRQLSPAARAVLLGPGPVARAAALRAATREERWMLCRPRQVRRSYVKEVIDRPDDPHAQERWMLRQDDEVRESYVREVLGEPY